jgi:hypothetical protein
VLDATGQSLTQSSERARHRHELHQWANYGDTG